MADEADRVLRLLGRMRRRATIRRNCRIALTGGDLHPEVASLLQTVTELSKNRRPTR